VKTRFSPEEYSLYRPPYWENFFRSLKPKISALQKNLNRPLRVLDLGGGTGISTESFLHFFPDVELVFSEPDSKMLDHAKQSLQRFSQVKQWFHLPAEALEFESESIDVILCACAWHWMNASLLAPKLERWLVPGGVLLIGEYQFPRAISLPLQEHLRRQFNLHWRAPLQTPRGTLSELLEPLRKMNDVSQDSRDAFEEMREHDPRELMGVIVSQSRFQWFEEKMEGDKKCSHREELQEILKSFFRKGDLDAESSTKLEFIYRFESFTFQKRWI
jgi:ubiquinone/menaquinone biosynthesis C-methylase UbiE